MFKKIHSNRDPRDTLYSELKKEFSVYVDKGTVVFKSMICGYPRFVFGLMIALLIASLTLAVALHHKILPEKKVATTSKNGTPPVNEGFDNIMAAGMALKQTIRLRRQVDSITARKGLTKSDSLTLLRDLDSLQHIRINLPH
jgi:hypothetical protein